MNHPNTYESLKRFIRVERESLAQFFGLSLIMYALLIVAIFLIAFGRYEKINEEKRIHTDGFTLVNLLTAFARSNLESDKQMDLYHVADIVKREKGLHYCIIMDVEGNPFVRIGEKFSDHSGIEQIIQNAISSDRPLKQVYEDPNGKNRICEFSKPIFSKGEKRGIVRLGIIPQSSFIFSKLNDSSVSLALVIIFPLAPVFYYLFRNSLRPLKDLQKKMDEVVTTDQFYEIDTKAKGEVGAITRQLNKLITFFTRKYHAVEKARKDLEISNRVEAYEKNKIGAILDHLGDGVLAINSEGQILYVNQSIENFFNISRQQVVGHTVEEFIQNETLLSFIKEMKKGTKGLGPKKQSVLTHSMDEKGTFRFVYSPLRNVEGDSLGELVIIKDITTQAMAEQARSEFLSHVAHEIRSPLNTIKSYTEMLMEGDIKDQETEKEFYNVITMETERLAKLIEDLLNISKIEMGSLTIKKGMVKPLNLIENCISAVMSQAVRKNIQVKKLLPESLSPLDIDKNLIEIALLNSISNAVKYTPEGGTITIQAEEEPDFTFLSVRDTGAGIREEDLPHIFDKFYRSSDESIQQQKGTGLGLSLAKEIVNLHGGEIKVESAVGEGSSFTFALPRDNDFERMF